MFGILLEPHAASFGSTSVVLQTPLGCLPLCAIVKTHKSKLQTFKIELPGRAKTLDNPNVRSIPVGLGS